MKKKMEKVADTSQELIPMGQQATGSDKGRGSQKEGGGGRQKKKRVGGSASSALLFTGQR